MTKEMFRDFAPDDNDQFLEDALKLLEADVRRSFGQNANLKLTYFSATMVEKPAAVYISVPKYRFSTGAFAMPQNFLDAIEVFARELTDTIVEGGFGAMEPWPLCPRHARLLSIEADPSSIFPYCATWVCRPFGLHSVSSVGKLPKTREGLAP